MNQPEYKIGDWVSCSFKGTLEGIEVRVTKRLFVWAVRMDREGQKPDDFVFDLCEKEPTKTEMGGKTYSKRASEISPLEPVIAAIIASATSEDSPSGNPAPSGTPPTAGPSHRSTA